MNPQDPLAALHPLREPPPIGWWPPAPGWWALALLCVLALALLAFFVLRRYRANAYRRKALAMLEQLYLRQQSQPDPARFQAELNTLLKGVALAAYPQRDVAAISGGQWLAFLNASLEEDARFPADFVRGAYHREPAPLDAGKLRDSARAWIKRHRSPS